MRIIPKLQTGSVVPFANYVPTPYIGEDNSSNTSTKKSDDENGSVTIKDIVKLADSLDGLPSDTNRLVKNIQKLYEEASLYNNGEIDSSQLVLLYLSTLLKARYAAYNKKLFDEALKTVTANDGLHLAAITLDGRIYVASNDGVKLVSSKEYLSNQDKYQIITNSDLLRDRAENSSSAFKNDYILTISNGIGFKGVTNIIQDVLNKIGSSEFLKQGYSAKLGDAILKGVELLEEAQKRALSEGHSMNPNELMTVDGLYKNKYITKDLAQQIDRALTYLYKVMPENAKTWLELKSNNASDPKLGALNLISLLMYASESTSYAFTPDLEENLNLDGSKKSSGSGEGGDTKADPAKAFIAGLGYQEDISFNLGNSVSITVNGIHGQLVKHSGEPLGSNCTLKDVTNSTFAPILNTKLASMGGLLLNQRALEHIILDSGDIVGMDLPIDEEAASLGIIKPNFAIMQKLEQAEETIYNQNITDESKINEIYESLGLPPKFRKNGKIWTLNDLSYARFAAVQGMADESSFLENPMFDKTLTEVTDGNEIEGYVEAMKAKDKNYKFSSGFFGLGSDIIYAGTIFIPVREDNVAASFGASQYYKLNKSDINQVSAAQQNANMLSTYQKPQSLSSLME